MRDASPPERLGHGADFCFQHVAGKALFKNKSHDHGARPGSGDGQIVDRSVHGQVADRTARKAQRMDDKTVGGECNGCVSCFDVSGI